MGKSMRQSQKSHQYKQWISTQILCLSFCETRKKTNANVFWVTLSKWYPSRNPDYYKCIENKRQREKRRGKGEERETCSRLTVSTAAMSTSSMKSTNDANTSCFSIEKRTTKSAHNDDGCYADCQPSSSKLMIFIIYLHFEIHFYIIVVLFFSVHKLKLMLSALVWIALL